MDSFRIFAGMVFAIAVFLLVDAWVKDHQKAAGPPPVATSAPRGETAPPVPSSTLEKATTVDAPRVAIDKLARRERIRVVSVAEDEHTCLGTSRIVEQQVLTKHLREARDLARAVLAWVL
jgi:hypothetical protein